METMKQGGPVAPKDPEAKRAKIYLMASEAIEAAERPDGSNCEIIFLEGRVEAKVNVICPGIDQDIVNALAHIESLKKIVHSIGVSITALDEEHRKDVATFCLEVYGKTDKYVTGSKHEMKVPLDGAMQTMLLSDWEENPEDDILGTLFFYFDQAHIGAKATICFHLNDGYDAPEPEIDPPVDFASENYQKMIAQSLMAEGNQARLFKVFEKAARGEEIVTAFIGGSITQGAGAKPQLANCYVYRTFEGLKKLLNTDKIRLVKAGVGGTSSEFGVVRYDRDVRKDGAVEPDFVVVEYAVNDEGDETKGVCYESLVKKILTGKNAPAVVLLFAVFMNDWNLQERLRPVGDLYDLPMVSVRDAVVPQFYEEERHVITKRQFFYDMYHPTNEGHQIMSDCLLHLFANAYEKFLADIAVEEQALPTGYAIGNTFAGIERFDRKNMPKDSSVEIGSFIGSDQSLQAAEFDLSEVASKCFTDNWHYDGNGANEDFVLKVCCKSAILVYKDEGSREFGAADIFVDGEYVRTVDPLEVGWVHCNTAVIIAKEDNASVKAAYHEIRIRMRKGDECKKFTILGFGLVR